MAEKTLYRQLISKYGVMSIEMQDAYTKDTTVLREDGSYEYVDNDNTIVNEAVVDEPKEQEKTATLDEI